MCVGMYVGKVGRWAEGRGGEGEKGETCDITHMLYVALLRPKQEAWYKTLVYGKHDDVASPVYVKLGFGAGDGVRDRHSASKLHYRRAALSSTCMLYVFIADINVQYS